MIVHRYRTLPGPVRVGELVAVELASPRPYPQPPGGHHHANVATTNGVPAAVAWLASLADEAGFTLDPDELDVATAQHPDQIIPWALLAARHDAYTRVLTLIDDPINALNDLTDHDPDGPDEYLLHQLHRYRRDLAHQLDALRQQFRRACAAITSDPTIGLLWPNPTIAATDEPHANGATVHMGGSMTNHSHVVLTHHTDRRLAAHGTYPTSASARAASTEIGFTDDTVTASTTAILVPPNHTDPDTAIRQHHHPAPDGLLEQLQAQPVPDQASTVVILLTDPGRSRFALVGPFPDQNAGRTWLQRHQHPTLSPHLLALRHPAPSHPDQDTTPQVILARTAQESFAYGPFPDALHATAWAHTLASMLDPRIHTLSLYPVAEPFDFTGRQPARPSAPVRPATAGNAHTYPRHSHVVLLHDNGDQSGLVGFFTDLADATDWGLTQRPHRYPTVVLTTMALLASVTLPAPPPDR